MLCSAILKLVIIFAGRTAKSRLFTMKSLVCKVLLVNLALIAATSSSSAQHVNLGSNNLSDNNKSFGKGAESDRIVVKNFQNLTRIEDLLDLFSIEEIGAQWTRLHDKLSPACSVDMLQYLSGLEQRKLWALKSECNFFIIRESCDAREIFVLFF